MNNSKLKYLILIVTLALILIPNKVEAKNFKEIDACLDGLTLNWSENGTAIDSPLDASKSVTLMATDTKKGRYWKISFGLYQGADETTDLFKKQNLDIPNLVKDFQPFNSEKPYTKTINLEKSEDSRLSVFITLEKDYDSGVKGSDGKTNIICHPGKFKITSDKKISLVRTDDESKSATGKSLTYKIIADDEDTVPNINRDKPACAQMRDGRYNNKEGKEDKNDIKRENLADYQDKAARYFPYCFNFEEKGIENPNFDISNKTINEIRKKFITYYNKVGTVVESTPAAKAAYSNLKETLKSTIGDPILVNGDSNANYVTNAGELSCEETQTGEKTVEKWAEKVILSNDYCAVSCIEEFNTIYDPPQTIKAGMCFSYKVTVKSKVTCKTEKKDNVDIWPEMKIKGCKFKALCDDETDQAGPNEEFDSCIQKCDEGKYSQSCINKCYKKIYENDNKKAKSKSSISKKLVSNINNKGKISFLENKIDTYKIYVYDEDNNEKFDLEKNCSSWSKLNKGNNLDMCAEGYRTAKSQDPLGYYKHEEKKKQWEWSPDFENGVSNNNNDIQDFEESADRKTGIGVNSITDSIKRVAPYYLRSIDATKDLLKSFFGKGTKLGKIYNIDNEGIKRQTTYNCKEHCWFKKSGADDCVYNDEKVADLYNKKLKAKQDQIEACVNAAKNSCSTTEAHFEIGANGDMKTGTNQSGNPENTIDHTGQNGGNYQIFTKLPTDKEEGSTGINGKCYGIELDYEHHYKTTITLPKSSLDYKTGKIVENCNDGTCIQKNMYCTRYDDIPVNQGIWYKRLIRQDQYVSNNGCTKKDTEINLNEGKIDYNINANVETFGKFNWQVSVDCFYALYNSVPEYKSKTNESTCTKTVLNRVVRAVDPKDPFNQKDTSKTRVPGFNWTSAATNKDKDSVVQASGYNKDPEQYLEEFTTKANNDTLYSDSELDFEANIGPSEINELKGMNKYIGQFNYGKCGVNVNDCYGRIGESDLYYYKSDLLKYLQGNNMKGNSQLKVIARRPDPGINNNGS